MEFNPDDEIEARWAEFDKDTWPDDPRTSGLKGEVIVGMRFSNLEYTIWENDYVDIDEVEKEPPTKPVTRHTPNFHKRYNPKQNYNKGNFNKRNFNHRRR